MRRTSAIVWLLLSVTVLLLPSCAADPPEAPRNADSLTSEEQKHDPLTAARKLLDLPEVAGNLDHAETLLAWHVERHPENPELQLLLAEAHSRAAEKLELAKPGDRAAHQRHRTEGLQHAELALKMMPNNGIAHYWVAALQLHIADAERSLGRAKEAIKHLDRADELTPAVDEGGPARLRGKVLADIPALFGGSLSRAIASYRRSLEVAPYHITTHLWLGQAYLDAKKPDLARKELEAAATGKLRPGHEKEDGDDQKKAQELLKKLETK
jgi:tetratricopeptide (TPR) repeat protein